MDTKPTPIDIWPLDTGILDLPDNAVELAAPELRWIGSVWQEQRERLKETAQLQRFTERLGRQWAIETGIIENLYEIERGITRTLIEQGFHAALLEHGSTNRPREYVLRLLDDQRDALEGLFDFVAQRRHLSTSYVKELHAALLRSQPDVEAVGPAGQTRRVPLIRGDWKLLPNYPSRGSALFRYCPPEQVASEMDRLIALHQEHTRRGVPTEVAAAWLHHRFSQIHPFQDGNGRVARALASLVFIQHGFFPLVVTRDDKVEYLNALEQADGGNLTPLIALCARLQRVQFRKALAISEYVLGEQVTVGHAVRGLVAAIDRRAQEKEARYREVLKLAPLLEQRIEQRLRELAEQLRPALARLHPQTPPAVHRSDPSTDHYFREQIVSIAREHLQYYADTGPYRSWVRLRLNWGRRASLVFAFHSAGVHFAGVLVCAPFLEFRSDEDEAERRSAPVNVASEPFEFHHSESAAEIEPRFDRWVDEVLTTSLTEIQQSL